MIAFSWNKWTAAAGNTVIDIHSRVQGRYLPHDYLLLLVDLRWSLLDIPFLVIKNKKSG
jgi:hypothetical protein